MASTHYSSVAGYQATTQRQIVESSSTILVLPLDGEFYFDTINNVTWVYNALKGQWMYAAFTTTTSTSTSTTTTSTSTTTTSTSSSTSTSTSTSTTTSTTTTL